jgi:hypothetical protein
MRYYVDGCVGEVSGMGKVEIIDGELTVTDCTIFEQSVSGAHSDIETQALAKFQVELVQKGEDLSVWKLWWHSHATMAVFWSGKDTDTIDNSTEFEYMVSLVTNHKHETKARVDTFKPLRLYSDLDVHIEEVVNEELKSACEAEIKAKVSKPALPSTHLGYRNIGAATTKKWYEDDDFFGQTYNVDGTPRTATLGLQNMELVGDAESKLVEEYYDTLEELENEVADAKDEATLQVATQALWEHKQKGIQKGW